MPDRFVSGPSRNIITRFLYSMIASVMAFFARFLTQLRRYCCDILHLIVKLVLQSFQKRPLLTFGTTIMPPCRGTSHTLTDISAQICSACHQEQHRQACDNHCRAPYRLANQISAMLEAPKPGRVSSCLLPPPPLLPHPHTTQQANIPTLHAAASCLTSLLTCCVLQGVRSSGCEGPMQSLTLHTEKPSSKLSGIALKMMFSQAHILGNPSCLSGG